VTAPYLWGINALIYNEKYVSEPPKSFMDLTKPEFTNKVSMPTIAENMYNCWGPVLGYDPAEMSQAELQKVTDFLIKLKRDQARVFTGNIDAEAQALVRGDIVAIAGAEWTMVATIAKQNGSDTVKYVLPEHGAISWTDTWAIPKGGPNRETAYAWIDYMVGPGNAKAAKNLSEAPVNREAIAAVKDPSTKALFTSEVQSKALPVVIPSGQNGSVHWQDWTEAWKRVEAA
jgi:spermidine/putrescine transport system substrate-binding protein